jgi:ribosomal protein S18 acetylase RimI-like enzyme
MIRRAGPEDAGALLALWIAAGSSPSVTDTIEDVTRAIEHPDGSVLVALSDARIVGSLIATWDGWRGNMYRLAVLPEFRRRGIAAELVREGEADLRHRGARRTSAIVLVDHDDAAAFWASVGYIFQAEAGRFTRMINDP